MCQSNSDIATLAYLPSPFLPLVGDDYIFTTFVLTFTSGTVPETTLFASIPIEEDLLVESTENIFLVMSGDAAADYDTLDATVEILDNDG